MMHDSEPSEQDGGGKKSAEDGIINCEVDSFKAKEWKDRNGLTVFALRRFVEVFKPLFAPVFCI